MIKITTFSIHIAYDVFKIFRLATSTWHLKYYDLFMLFYFITKKPNMFLLNIKVFTQNKRQVREYASQVHSYKQSNFGTTQLTFYTECGQPFQKAKIYQSISNYWNSFFNSQFLCPNHPLVLSLDFATSQAGFPHS